MKLILDTHVLLWALAEPERMDDARRQLIEDGSNTVYVSSVNAAEAELLRSLPFHRRDPFDRMLVCQSLHRKLPIATNDGMSGRYGCEVV